MLFLCKDKRRKNRKTPCNACLQGVFLMVCLLNFNYFTKKPKNFFAETKMFSFLSVFAAAMPFASLCSPWAVVPARWDTFPADSYTKMHQTGHLRLRLADWKLLSEAAGNRFRKERCHTALSMLFAPKARQKLYPYQREQHYHLLLPFFFLLCFEIGFVVLFVDLVGSFCFDYCFHLPL